VVNSFFDKGLRLVQLTKEQLIDLPVIMERLRDFSSKKFIIFLDDLSFEEFEVEYKLCKSIKILLSNAFPYSLQHFNKKLNTPAKIIL
jgi:predicted AAA+ superfamily ATPase